jgi:protein-tyrosine phosphatase
MRTSAEPLDLDFLPAAALGTPGRLGLSSAPGLWGPGRGLDPDRRLREALGELVKGYGASVLVTLLEQSEIDVLGSLGREARRAGLTWIHFPIPDMWVPADLVATRRLCRSIVRKLEAGENVVIHCWAGLGRTGTIAAACLIERGARPADAMRSVRAARDGAIQSDAQEQFVLGYGQDEEWG